MGDEVETPPEVSSEQARSSRGGIGLGQPKVTECLIRTTKKSRDEAKSYLPIYEEYADQRPKTRGDCVEGARPCPWVSCKFNNYLDVKMNGPTAGMSIIFNFPDKEPEDVAPERSCALDIADQGGATLEDVAKLTNLTRERIRQVQAKALLRAERSLEKLGYIDEDQYRGDPVTSHEASGSILKAKVRPEVVESEQLDTPSSDELSLGDGDAVGFLIDHPRAEVLITARVWRIYLRTSNERAVGTRVDLKRPQVVEDVPLPIRVAPRHNVNMALKKKIKSKSKSKKMLRSLGDLNYREKQILDAYTELRSESGGVPNNHQIAKLTKLTVSAVGHVRKALVAINLMAPSPRGATSAGSSWGRKKQPKSVQKTLTEHQQLPDDAKLSTAHVLALSRGPIADAANAIRSEIVTIDQQRAKLVAALNVLGDLV